MTIITASTRRLNLRASCLVGQCALRSSATTSTKKLNLDFLAGTDLALAFLTRVAIGYFVSRWRVEPRQEGQYFFSSSRCGSFFLFFVVVYVLC
jgi:hypothetical protein